MSDLAGGLWPQGLPCASLHSDPWLDLSVIALAAWAVLVRAVRCTGILPAQHVHNTPEYNGISERLNRMLLEQMRALLHLSKLPKNLWGEAINHDIWLKNRTPTQALPDGKTQYEMLYGKKPNLRNLHEWGNQVWIHTLEGTKLDG